jgi:Trypsin-co-occurring domain 2
MAEITLHQLVTDLRRELQRAADEGRGENLRFTVDRIEVELELGIVADASVSGAVKFLVFELGTEASRERHGRHKFKLEMTPTREGRRLEVGDATSAQPK